MKNDASFADRAAMATAPTARPGNTSTAAAPISAAGAAQPAAVADALTIPTTSTRSDRRPSLKEGNPVTRVRLWLPDSLLGLVEKRL